MTLKTMLQDNIKDYYHGKFINKLNEYSEQERKEINDLITYIKNELESKTKKGSFYVKIYLKESDRKYLHAVVMLWAYSELLYVETSTFPEDGGIVFNLNK